MCPKPELAYITEEGKLSNSDAASRTLWVSDFARPPRKLLEPTASSDPKSNLLSLEHPVWSLDGGYVYVLADAWVTSSAVHQVNVKTGAERFVIDGNSLRVIRTGPYRGMLLVGRHKYHPAPQLGSYDPVDVVRPDGKVILTVPGSETDEGDPSVAHWLKAHGWSAN